MATAILDTDYDKAAKALSNVAHIQHVVAAAIAEERERCAQVAEHLNGWGHPRAPDLAEHIAKVIRRG